MENKFSKAPQLTIALKKRRTYSEDKKDVTVLVKKITIMAHFVLNSLENDPNIHRNFKLTVIFNKITAK